jgi:hypothetical protein
MPSRIVWSFVGLCVLAGACRDAPRPVGRQFRSVVLAPDSSNLRQLLSPCRPGPSDVTGVWTPSSAEVALADSLVIAQLASQLAGVRWPPSTPDSVRPLARDYFVQYIAVRINGEPVLYVNGFHRVTVQYDRDTLAWLHRPIIVCDGGPTAFGAEVWVRQKMVRAFTFNGYA